MVIECFSSAACVSHIVPEQQPQEPSLTLGKALQWFPGMAHAKCQSASLCVELQCLILRGLEAFSPVAAVATSKNKREHMSQLLLHIKLWVISFYSAETRTAPLSKARQPEF